MPVIVHLTFVAMLAGVELEESILLNSKPLTLSSCGVRDTLWIEHYAAGLYVPPGASAQVVRDPNHPKAVRMKIIDGRYLPERIPEKWREVLQRELKADPLARVRTAYGRLASGDVVTVSYVPDEGVTMQVNGKVVARGMRHDLIREMLEAWAQDDPISGKLRRLALRHPC